MCFDAHPALPYAFCLWMKGKGRGINKETTRSLSDFFQSTCVRRPPKAMEIFFRYRGSTFFFLVIHFYS